MPSGARRLLVDTDVLIEYLRGQDRAAEYLEGLEEGLHVSSITVAELFAGVRQGEEEQLGSFLLAFTVLPVSKDVAELGGRLRRDHGSTHGTGLADAIVAATAQFHEATLVTFNDRHFPMLDEVQVPYERD